MSDRRQTAEGQGLEGPRLARAVADPSSERLEARGSAARGERGGSRLAIAGLALVGVSLFMLFTNVQVSGGLFGSLGLHQFGWSLLPLLFGVGWIVLRPRGLGGWALAAVGLAILVIEIIGSLTFYYRPVSLLQTLIMLLPGAAGLSLLVRNL